MEYMKSPFNVNITHKNAQIINNLTKYIMISTLMMYIRISVYWLADPDVKKDFLDRQKFLKKEIPQDAIPKLLEKIDRALKRYKKKFKKTGLIKQLRELEYYEKPSTKRRKIIDKAKYIQKQKEKDGDI